MDQNISNPHEIFWLKCTPDLKEDIIGLDDYRVTSNEYNCLWLFQHLNPITFCANRYQYEYLSYVRYLKSLLKICQKDNESTEVIYKHLEYALLSMKLVGCNMNPEELQYKEKVNNPSRSYEYTDVTAEEKFMGTLLIESSRNKKYGDLKRLIINSMIQGKKLHPNSKADT